VRGHGGADPCSRMRDSNSETAKLRGRRYLTLTLLAPVRRMMDEATKSVSANDVGVGISKLLRRL
jgi:hypothetical protein